MNNLLNLAFKTLKPRLWLYFGGTYLIGFLYGAKEIKDIISPWFLINFLYFLIPANIFLQGISELITKHTKKERSQYLVLLSICVALTGIMLILQKNTTEKTLFLLFISLAVLEGIEGIRFLKKPIIDLFSKMVYIIPGLLGFVNINGQLPSNTGIAALVLWIIGLHLFSQIPESDKNKQQFQKTADFFGTTFSLIISALLWFISAALIIVELRPLGSFAIAALLYPFIPLSLLVQQNRNIKEAQNKLLLINVSVGTLLLIDSVIHTL